MTANGTGKCSFKMIIASIALIIDKPQCGLTLIHLSFCFSIASSFLKSSITTYEKGTSTCSSSHRCISAPRIAKTSSFPQTPGVQPTISPGRFQSRHSSWRRVNPRCRHDEEMTIFAPVLSIIHLRFFTASLSK